VRIAAARRLAWGLLAFGIVLAGAGLALSALNGERGGLLSITLFTVTFLGFGLTGSLVASRRPDNPIGLILCGVGLSFALGGSVEVLSSTGSGTKILGRVPAPEYTS
jgi:hypothetical protein